MMVRSWRQLQNTRRAHQLAVVRILESRQKIRTVAAIEPEMRRVRFSPITLEILVSSCFPLPKKTVFDSPWSEIFWNLLCQHEFLIRGEILKSVVRKNTGSGSSDFVEQEYECLANHDDAERTRQCILHLYVEAFHTHMLQLASIWLGKLDRLLEVSVVILHGTLINIASLAKTLRARYVTRDEHPPPEPLALIPTIQPNAPSA